MKRYLSILFLLLIATVLVSCSGGGNGSGGSVALPGDTVAPTVTAFVIQPTASSLTVPVVFTATDNVGVTGYMVTTTNVPPRANDPGWSTTPLTSVTFTSIGLLNVYAWARDGSGNVSPAGTGTITLANVPAPDVLGTGIDAQTGLPIAGATVNAYLQSAPGTVVSSATTDANGNFAMSGLFIGENYKFEFVQAGYVLLTYYNIVPDVTIVNLETFKPIPDAWQPQTASVSGMVKNASTNAGLPAMTVTLRPGINNQNVGSITATTVTDATGAYSFANLAAGTYTAEITGNIGTTPIITSYFTLYSFPGNISVNTNQDFPVTAAAGPGQYKIVLSWGNSPSDLDSHLTGPTTTSGVRFHTAYYSVAYPLGSTTAGATGFRIAGATTEAFLDVDNVSHGVDNGPETTTIVVPHTGTYRFYVHHFAGSSTISLSGAQVKVYKGSAQIATFNPPVSASGVGAVWSVFVMDVTATGQSIRPVNTISVIPTSSLARLAGNGFEEYYLFSDLPLK